MPRPLRALIHLDAIRQNYRLAKQLAPRARALAVVKADGYGHGALMVARALAEEADGFAVACVEEALELRESGIQGLIVLLNGLFSPDELALVEQAHLTPVLHSPTQVEWLLAAHPTRPLDCWLKMDSGMHRVGLAPADVPAAYARLRACPHIRALVLMSHFARADEPDHPATARQMQVFEQATVALRAPRSLANSAAVLTYAGSHADWIRPGILLYGVSPLDMDHPSHGLLQPAMTLESALISVREVAAGESIGYGGRFVCDRPMQVGVAAIGYADGYPRHAPDGTPVAVKGHLTRIIGRVSMDLATLDLTGIPDAKVGDPVELWGSLVPVSSVASASGTIAYELLTGVSKRVPRVFV